jgi:hypothetical protein
MKAPENQYKGTTDLGDMREWVMQDINSAETIIRYDTIVAGKQRHCHYRGKRDDAVKIIKKIRIIAREMLRSGQYEEFTV